MTACFVSTSQTRRATLFQMNLTRTCISTFPRSLIRHSYQHAPSTRPLKMDAIVSQDPSTHSLKVLPHTQYHTHTHLSPSTCPPTPLPLFEQWFTHAISNGVKEPEAMTLATCTPTGIPSARTVLFKALDATGFTFFTNYESRKSREMEETGHAALMFYWREIHRSVRVVGTVEKIAKDESEAYFRSRPVGSRIGAWASPQSQVIGEEEIHDRVEEIKAKFGIQAEEGVVDIPLPPFWGGWRVVPTEVEFWCGKPSRLHDRVRYLRPDANTEAWTVDRLSP